MTAPLWTPSAERIAAANITAFMRAVEEQWNVSAADYTSLYDFSLHRPENFWKSVWAFTNVRGTMGERVVEDFDHMPGARFFPEARLNFAENLLRRTDDRPAILFKGENGTERSLSAHDLRLAVGRFASALREIGVVAGDRVAAFIPNIPEAVVGALGAAAVGAVWSSCSPDFGVQGVVNRFGQIEPDVLVTADGYFYAGRAHDSLARVRQVLDAIPSVTTTVVVPFVEESPSLDGLRGGVLWNDFAGGGRGELHFEQLPFNHPLYILYSSGTTGVPKCIVHGAGGTLIQHVKELQLHCDIKAGDRVFYFTTCGWMMWNWLISSLASEATLVLYDGSPFHPHGDVLFDLADATSLRSLVRPPKFMAALEKACSSRGGRTPEPSGRSLRPAPRSRRRASTLSTEHQADVHLASIPEAPTSSAASRWESGGSGVAGGVQVRGLGHGGRGLRRDGRPVGGEKGELVCTGPFPSMPIGFWNDPDGRRSRDAYFEHLSGRLAARRLRRADRTRRPDHLRPVRRHPESRRCPYRHRRDLPPGRANPRSAGEPRDGQVLQGDQRIVLFVRLRVDMTLTEDCARIKRGFAKRPPAACSDAHLPSRRHPVHSKAGKIVELAVRAM